MVPGDRERKDDELAQTATAPGGSAPANSDAAPLGDQLGRYKIQRELGRGGMGVVYAVFDPDLERKVALKVLRGAGDSAEARQRLLREARAMARLAHPNVLTVHEVGSANGQDFIAMELVEGSTLEDWLASPRSEREIIAAFIAAGQGLAAAHAAGLVHRDFKPRNVLRHKDGRIVVTDFGLVVGVAQQVDVLTTTLPAGATVDSSTTPSSLSGLTQTGALLGTPAYMAPEQWSGGAIGPPADQFAFCVALWEALAKERPYKGTTLDALKDAVSNAKRSDIGKLPRRLRRILQKGLNPDPAKRFASMDALLAAMKRAERRPGVAIAIVGGALVVTGIVIAVVPRSTPPPSAAAQACRPPALESGKTWTARDAQLLTDAHQSLAARQLERDFSAWNQARATACAAADAEREAKLACLDGVLARFSALERATLSAKSDDNQEVAGDLIDPKVCLAPKPPRLTRADLFDVFVANITAGRVGTPFEPAAQAALLERTAKEPCASAVAHLVVATQKPGPERRQRLDEAERSAESCGDDRIAADIAVYRAFLAIQFSSPSATQELAKADALVARVAQADLTARLEYYRAINAASGDDFDHAIEGLTRAVSLYDQRGALRASIVTSLRLLDIRQLRAHPDDVSAIMPSLQALRSRATSELGPDDTLVRTIDGHIADWMWRNGDVAGADALQEKSIIPATVDAPRDVVGHVVDEQGRPVAGAEVAAAGSLVGDSLHAAIPNSGVTRAITRADGTFELHGIPRESICIAQLGDRRSAPAHVADDLTLKVMPTSRVSGKVDLKTRPSQVVTVAASDSSSKLIRYGVAAPVLPDGSFSLAGVPRGRTQFEVTARVHSGFAASASQKEITVAAPVIADVQLSVMQGRDLHVLARSMYGVELPLAQVFVVPGKRPTDTNVAALLPSIQNVTLRVTTPLAEQSVNDEVRKAAQPGDLYAKVTDVTDGEASACALPLPAHPDDPKIEAILSDPHNLAKIPVHCTPVKPGDTIVIAPVPPWPRFD